MEESVAALQALGLTELEAAAYAFLLGESPATAYRVAQALGKPTANMYKAIASLAEKGAVIVEEGEARQCRAVPYAELLAQMEQRFRERKARAEEALSKLGSSEEDTRVYQLKTQAQVIERVRQMLQRAKKVAMASIFPVPLKELKADLEAAAERGVCVMVKVYTESRLHVSHVVLSSQGEQLVREWPGQEVSLVIDGEEYLDAILTQDGKGLIQAVTSGSLFLSFSRYNGLYCELLLTTLVGRMKDERLETLLSELMLPYHPNLTPGFERLIRTRTDKESVSASSGVAHLVDSVLETLARL